MTIYVNYIDRQKKDPKWEHHYLRKFEDVDDYNYSEEYNTLWITKGDDDIQAMIKIEDGMYFTVHGENQSVNRQKNKFASEYGVMLNG